jgi:TetR/AcrR family transcriptional regulator
MNMTDQNSTSTTERSTETRARILDAALSEFALHGLAGARTERIASAAGVNKALLYYHFDSKEKLYLAAFEMIAGRVRDSSMAVFFREDSTPGERVMRTALNHFDRVIGQQEFQSLMQQEMMRLHKGEWGVMPVLVKRVFEPLLVMYQAMVREGVESGELIHADWLQIHLASLGANVFYFLSAPVFQLVTGADPLAIEALAERRKAIVDFLGQAIFTDRQHGAALAAKIFADTPMPEIVGGRVNFGRNV